MAKLLVSPEFLVSQLFQGAAPSVRIYGARYDVFKDAIVLDIAGPEVPAVDEVVAEITVRSTQIVFRPVK